MDENIDQSSFASILAGVRKMRKDYDVQGPEVVVPPTSQSSKEVEKDSSSNDKDSGLGKDLQRRPKAKPAESSIPTPSEKSGSSGRPTRRMPSNNVQSYTQVQVANSQKGNPLLESPQMKITPWAYNSQILSDYYINATIQVLFLSLKYHKLRPEYVWRRLEKLKGGSSITDFNKKDEALRILLVVVDIDSPEETLRALSVLCMKNDLTMLIAWSFEEAGSYVASLKQNEMAKTKINSSIQGIKKGDYNSNIVNTLTIIRAVNKTDVANLLANYKSFKKIVETSSQDDGFTGIQGLGERKMQNLRAVFNEPFVFNKNW